MPTIFASTERIPRFGRIIGESPLLVQATRLLERAAKVDFPVLLFGETGCGKELFAREIHERSNRRNGPYVALNAGALSTGLVASELFGHAKGAFTGALKSTEGRFGEANNGTLFLDEIGTIDDRAQVALLRVLERGTYRPVGGQHDYQTNARLVAATNENLNEAAEHGRFRTDLLHRLQVVQINIPPLREILRDIPHLVADIIQRLATELQYDIRGVDAEAMEWLLRYSWPGNVRELRNVLAQAAVLAETGYITPEHLPERIINLEELNTEDSPRSGHNRTPNVGGVERADSPMVSKGDDESENETLQFRVGGSLVELEKAYIEKTLALCDNNKTQAAKVLGISRKTLYDRLERWNIKCS